MRQIRLCISIPDGVDGADILNRIEKAGLKFDKAADRAALDRDDVIYFSRDAGVDATGYRTGGTTTPTDAELDRDVAEQVARINGKMTSTGDPTLDEADAESRKIRQSAGLTD